MRISAISERNCINGNGSIDSLKIKLKGDSRQTYKKYKKLLKKLKLEDNLKTMVSVNQDIQRNIAECKSNLRSTLFTAGIAAIMLSFLYIQSIILNFEINNREYMIKKVNGFSKAKIYYKYNIKQYLTILIIMTIYLIIAGKDYLTYTFLVALLLLGIQTTITGICTKKVENKNLVYVLKGE
ncbi:DUF1430 domain-containing protein [Eubacterium sp. MSJ-13]|uniref:DUF1430 domain-containing protein n=1 Tax=Eubacterium sp. MSJ-13 TaxID=2841513 RepID=UPI001C10FD39|nr:DUF1430 domain-containing protein [Eubacterium sp. MSJ-13]MBU5477978.1 DUF1430 domain-containing protein [Eubacterium sp. MSJ-13]